MYRELIDRDNSIRSLLDGLIRAIFPYESSWRAMKSELGNLCSGLEHSTSFNFSPSGTLALPATFQPLMKRLPLCFWMSASWQTSTVPNPDDQNFSDALKRIPLPTTMTYIISTELIVLTFGKCDRPLLRYARA